MKHYSLFAAILFAAILAFSACDKDEPLTDDNGEGTENSTPGGTTTPGGTGTSVSIPDCFVYYKGAKFIFKRTLNNKTSSKITWTVTEYSSGTATVQEVRGDDNPTTFQIRKGGKSIEFNTGSGWKQLTDGGSTINFMNGSKLNSIPSGCYGSVKDETKVTSVSIPGGKTTSGFSISSSYSTYSGAHDSFLFDYSSGESWSTECGFVSSGYWYQNGKEYPIYSARTTVELVAYDIPMPDGSRRSYAPAGSTVYDVTETNFRCYQNSYKTQRYACITGLWNDKKNTNVMRYLLCVLWYDNGWTYGHLTNDFHTKWELGSWFAGEPYSSTGIGGPYNGVKFDCSGYYSSFDGSQSYSPFDAAGYYIFFVVAENAVNVGEPDMENTVFTLLYIPNEGSADTTYSDRVTLLDDGTVDAYTKTKATPEGVRPCAPDPSWIKGAVHRLK